MADPRIYSLDLEDEYYNRSVAPYVPKEERMNNRYPNTYPLGIDRYRVDFKKPTLNLRSRDAASEQNDIWYGWKRLGYEAKQRWAFAPSENYKKVNIALLTGHPSGKVGITGELITEEIDDNLGGGYFADMSHVDYNARNQVVPPNKLRF